MGTFRFFLAYCVLYSHLIGNVFGFNIGIVAVISFLILSGYVMVLLINKHYPSAKQIGAFYLDRMARIFPQYLFYLALTLLLTQLMGLTSEFYHNVELRDIPQNVLLVPLGYYMFLPVAQSYIPQAWSLGLELTFYLFFPFFWLLPRGWKYGVLSVSIVIFAIALLGILATEDWYVYRLLPGVFFIFAVGSSLADSTKISSKYPVLVFVLALLATVMVFASPKLCATLHNREVTLGLVLGIIAVAFLRKYRFRSIDEFLGNLSYGIFLNHYLVMAVMGKLGIRHFARLSVVVVSLVFAWLSYRFVEKPALDWRRKLRTERSIAVT
jgi:peptidoglycan/LPS O-acetylase OafA/YrhL